MASSLVLTGGAAVAKTLKETITQTAHGFTVGDVIRWDATAATPKYVLAQADSATNAEVAGVVSAKSDANTFDITYSGYIDVPQFSGISFPVMFLSSVAGGSLSATPPSAIGTVVKPVLTRNTNGSGHLVMNYLGTQIGGSSTVAVDEIQPVGTIMPFAGNAIPDTWLPCNASLYSITDYPELYSKLCYSTGDRVPMYGHIVELTLSSIPSGTAVGDFILLPKSGQSFPAMGTVTDETTQIGAVLLVEGQIRAIDTANNKITVSTSWIYNSTKKYFEYVNATFRAASNYTIISPSGGWVTASLRGTVNGTSVTAARITHFYTPDLTSRFLVGADASALYVPGGQPDDFTFSLGNNLLDESRNTVYGMGAFGGEEQHTLTKAEMPSHTHQLYGLTASITYTTGNNGLVVNVGSDGVLQTNPSWIGATGNNTPHNNIPPYLAVRYIIKAKPYTRAAIVDGIDLPYNSLLVRDLRSRNVGGSNGDLVFHTNTSGDSGNGTERMRLTAGGTLGIGVASGFGSTYSVQIAGNVNTTGTVVMANPFMFRNRIINGNMRINQRYGLTGGGMEPNSADPPITGGLNWTQIQNTRTYTCDRWATHAIDTGNKMSQLSWGTFVANEANIPVGFKNYLRVKRTSTAVTEANGDWFAIVQPIEGDNVLDLGWNRGTVTGAQSATVSFWVRSSVTGRFAFGVQQHHSTAPSQYSYYNTSYTINQANTWEYKTITIPPNTTGVIGFLTLYVYFMMGKNLSATTVAPNTWTTTNTQSTTETIDGMVSTVNADWNITGVQFEVGTVATPFEQRPLSVEQSLCERYYEKSYELDTKPGTFTPKGNHNRRYVLMSSTNQEFDYIRYRVPKRTRAFNERNAWTAGTVIGEPGISTKDYVWVSDGTKTAASYSTGEDSTNNLYVGFYLGGKGAGTAVAFNWAVDAEI